MKTIKGKVKVSNDELSLTDAARSAMENAQLLVVLNTSKRAVEIGFLAARAFYGEGPRNIEDEIKHARTEQEIAGKPPTIEQLAQLAQSVALFESRVVALVEHLEAGLCLYPKIRKKW